MARRYGYRFTTGFPTLMGLRCNFSSVKIKPAITTIGEHWHDPVLSPFQTREVCQLSPQALSAFTLRLHALRVSGSEIVLLISILWADTIKDIYGCQEDFLKNNWRGKTGKCIPGSTADIQTLLIQCSEHVGMERHEVSHPPHRPMHCRHMDSE